MIVVEKLIVIPKTSCDKRPLGLFQRYADSIVDHRCLEGEKRSILRVKKCGFFSLMGSNSKTILAHYFIEEKTVNCKVYITALLSSTEEVTDFFNLYFPQIFTLRLWSVPAGEVLLWTETASEVLALETSSYTVSKAK